MTATLQFDPADREVLEAAREGRFEPAAWLRLHLEAERIALIEGFEELLCLPQLRGVERYPHQERTALRVMRRLRGRAILADEVGLGKTIEAGLVIKELLLRGLARRVLVLCPPSLVEQWQAELEGKFGLPFITHSDPEFRAAGPDAWQSHDRVVASLATARHARHREPLLAAGCDLVVVDEAHHLRQRTSAAYRLVHDLPRKYLLLLTATPVHNDLEELYNLITLLRPGQLGTPAEFRRRFVDPRDRRRPRHVHTLRELMMDVMIRNTRGSVEVALPPRHSRTVRVKPDPGEAKLLRSVSELVRSRWGTAPSMALTTLLLEAGSSPAALTATLEKMGQPDLALESALLGLGSKAGALLEVVRSLAEPTLVFTRFRATLDALARFLASQGVEVFQYHGGIPPDRREEELRRFTSGSGLRVMLMSEVGGEGKNLQDLRNLVNFDLPWSPMRIEQRVGRLHRIGQTRTIRIVNLCLQGSMEDHILRLLEEKLNLIELVVGELETILGPLEEEGDFEDLLAELAATSKDGEELARRMDELGDRMVEQRRAYEESRAYDESLFGADFEVEP